MTASDPNPRPVGIPDEGAIIGGKYRVGELIGIGGMGAIVGAHHVELGTRVAIKILLPELARQPEWTARLLREARAIASIHSERVAQVYDVGRLDDGTPYIVMERLEGTNLDRELRDRGPLSLEQTVDIVLEVCEALGEAHRHGIVHRDLKPSNLFLTERADGSRVVKVLDFGISKALLPGNLANNISSLTRTQSVLGSPQYMSPEQIRCSKDVDHRTDIWALGVILHKLVTGRLPFEATTAAAYLVKAAMDPPTPLTSHKSELPKRLEKIVLRCLEKDAARRYGNVAQLARALLPFASAAGIACGERTLELLGEDPSEQPPESSDPARDSSASAAIKPVVPVPRARRSRVIVSASLTLGIVIALAGLLINAARHRSPAPQASQEAAVPALPAPTASNPSRDPKPAATAATETPVEAPKAVVRSNSVARPRVPKASTSSASASAPPAESAPAQKLPDPAPTPPKLKGPMESEL